MDDKRTLYSGELVDTYGGDFTYRDIVYEVDEEDGVKVYRFYERLSGAKAYGAYGHPLDDERIYDEADIKEYTAAVKELEAKGWG